MNRIGIIFLFIVTQTTACTSGPVVRLLVPMETVIANIDAGWVDGESIVLKAEGVDPEGNLYFLGGKLAFPPDIEEQFEAQWQWYLRQSVIECPDVGVIPVPKDKPESVQFQPETEAFSVQYQNGSMALLKAYNFSPNKAADALPAYRCDGVSDLIVINDRRR